MIPLRNSRKPTLSFCPLGVELSEKVAADGELCECLNAQNMDKNDTNRMTAQRRKHSRTEKIHVKSTRMSIADTRSMLGLMAEHTPSLLMEDITPAFAPPDEIVNNVSNQDAGFGYKNRSSHGKKNL